MSQATKPLLKEKAIVSLVSFPYASWNPKRNIINIKPSSIVNAINEVEKYLSVPMSKTYFNWIYVPNSMMPDVVYAGLYQRKIWA